MRMGRSVKGDRSREAAESVQLVQGTAPDVVFFFFYDRSVFIFILFLLIFLIYYM